MTASFVLRLMMLTLVIDTRLSAQVSQPHNQSDLLAKLLDKSHRAAAISEIRKLPQAAFPAILESISRLDTVHVDPFQLNDAIAAVIDVCGEKRVTEAIPFLIQHLLLDRYRNGFIWLKSDESILARMPAMNALVHMGTVASQALIQAYSSQKAENHRIAFVFVVSRIADPTAKEFLNSIIANASIETKYAQEGLIKLAKP